MVTAAPSAELVHPLCVALDLADPGDCRRVAAAVAPHAGALKVGLTAFVAGGPGLVRDVARLRPVFLDLKLHDIPAQVGGAVARVGELGARWLTVHASGGGAMVAAAAEAAPDSLVVLGVTVLTSLDNADLAATGVARRVSDQVARLAELAVGAGAGGLVCSPLEVAALRSRFGERRSGGPWLVVPGVRPVGGAAHDQRRVATPAEALAAGADLVVVGRPIVSARDPVEAARALHVACAPEGPR
jgi:orotidine-5'-phosphate decarboxylase